MLLYAGADWCGPCRKLREELKRPDVRRSWRRGRASTLTSTSSPAPGGMEFSSIPAVRLLTSSGRLVASQDGYVTGEEFARWLDDNRAKAQSPLDADLAASEPPEGPVLDRLVAALADPDAAVRESAVRRLAPTPWSPRKRSSSGSKSRNSPRPGRAGAVPGVGTRPWATWTHGAETITPARAQGLKDWAAAMVRDGRNQTRRRLVRCFRHEHSRHEACVTPATPATGPAALGVQRLEEARQELDRLARAGDEAEARRRDRAPRPARPGAVPAVYDRLRRPGRRSARAADDAALPAGRLQRGGRLAGRCSRGSPPPAPPRATPPPRNSSSATPDDGPLLVELFSDPDPLVREISLRGIRTVGIGGGGAASAAPALGPPRQIHRPHPHPPRQRAPPPGRWRGCSTTRCPTSVRRC